MKCPYCNSENNYVTDTRTKNGEYKRRRKCLCCGKRFNTIEVYVPDEIVKSKKGNRKK